jgi:ElaB/YqjD/DUF883 family membrane-anchored ribosome-binding protein
VTGVLEGHKIESDNEVNKSCGGNCCGQDAREMAERLEKGVHDATAEISVKLADGKIAAERFFRRGQYTLEAGVTEIVHKLKRHPVNSIAIAFAVGAAVGLLVPRASRR